MPSFLPPDSPARPPTRLDHVLVPAIAVAAAAGALAAQSEPTGTTVADAVWSIVFAVLVVLAGAKARRWTWIVAAGIAAAAAPSLVVGLPAFGALILAIVNGAVSRRRRFIGALVLALALQTLLRLDLDEPFGLSTLVAAVALLPALLSGFSLCRPTTRRVLVAGGVVVVVVSVGLAVAQVMAVVDARPSVEAGIDAAQAGFDAARDGDEATAVTQFTEAQAAFAEADDVLSSPWARAGRAVPVLGQHARAIGEITGSGVRLTATAAQAAEEAPIDELQFQDGVLDLQQVAAFTEPVARTEAALVDADATATDVDRGWLLGPLADRVDQFAAEIDAALPEAELARRGVAVAPGLFGGEGTRRYLLAFMTPAEQRALGGFIGNFGVLTANGGDLTLARSDPIAAFERALPEGGAEVTHPEDFVARYARNQPGGQPGDTTLSPDFPSVAEVLGQTYPAAYDRDLDGVILVDPYALQALLTFTGPIRVTGYDTPLTSENAAEFLLREQYALFGDRDDRKDYLEEASRLTFEALTSGDLPGPRRLTEVLGPMVNEGRLLVHSFHPEEQAFFEQVGLDGAFPLAGGGDLLAVTTQNSGHNKIDVYLTRLVDYDATIDPGDGTVTATATVTLVNTAPPGPQPGGVTDTNPVPETPDLPALPPGNNAMIVSLYSPLGLEASSADGAPVEVIAERELGVNVYSQDVIVPPESTVTLTYELLGGVDLADGYRLAYAGQPTVNPDQVSVRLTTVEGWTLTGRRGLEPDGDDLTATWTGPEDRVLRAKLDDD